MHDPVTVTREVAVQVERALLTKWTALRKALDRRCVGTLPDQDEAETRQWRTARAAILLMGDSGLRRDEAAHARREDLRPYVSQSVRSSPQTPQGSNHTPVWALTVIGKRRKQRTVRSVRRWSLPCATSGSTVNGISMSRSTRRRAG